jgi:hypothetical protein
VAHSDFNSVIMDRLNAIDKNISWLAKESHISISHLNNLLDGRRRWNEDTKAKVCKVLNIVTEYRFVS